MLRLLHLGPLRLMAITRRTLRLSKDLRVTIAAETDQVTRQIVQAWASAWDGMAEEMSAAVDDLLRVGAGEWPTRAQVNRATRAQKALGTAREALADLAADARIAIVDAAGRSVSLAAEAQPAIIASQLPPAAGNAASLAASFDRVSPQAIKAIVRRSTRQITSLTRPLTPEATNAMKRALVRGVAVGENPRVSARRMLQKLEGGFNGGATRALTVARTEILDAHRAGAAEAQRANADMLAGWVWTAELDARTCPSCWSQHGGVHSLDEDGPDDHQQGRCARVPQAKTWRELGFHGLDEPPSVLPDARTVFDGLPARDRLAVMGPQRLAALDNGTVGWGEFTQLRRTDGWRDSYGVTPVKDLLLR